jgi:hypothetical protein
VSSRGRLLAATARLSIFLVTVASPRKAAAEDLRRIEVVLATDPAASENVLSVLRSTMARQGLQLVAVTVPRIDPLEIVHSRPHGSPADPVAQLWLDLTAKQPHMVLVGVASGRVYLRPLAVRAAPDVVELELIRFVVDSSVGAILAGRALGVSRSEFERSVSPPAAAVATAPPVPPTPRPRLAWSIAAGYSAAALASDVVAHGPELTGELRWRRLHVGLIAMYRSPVTVTGAGVDTRLLSTGARLYAAVPLAIPGRLLASVGLGAGIDATRVAPDGPGATAAFWVTDPLLMVLTTLQRTFGHVVAAVDAGLDGDLLAARYAAIRSGQTTVLWTPSRLRPFAAARLGVSF